MEVKKTQLIQKIQSFNLIYVEIELEISLIKIHNLFINNELGELPVSSIEFLYYGVYYRFVKTDYVNMKKCYLESIKLGCIFGMRNMGCYYRDVKDNHKKSKQYFQMAADKDSWEAHESLGFHYQYYEKNTFFMKKHYLIAIEHGRHKGAGYHLGLYYLTDEHEKNVELAKMYLGMAVENGSIFAMNLLGVLYMKDDKNDELSKKYLDMAVNSGCLKSINNLGYWYHIIGKDLVEAERLYLMALDKNADSDSMCNLGLLYKEQNKLDLTKKYFLMGIEKNNVNTMLCFAVYYKTTKNKPHKVEKYYLLAIEHGSVVAMSNYALHCQQVKVDFANAKRYWLMAIEHGSKLAMANLGTHFLDYEKDDEQMEKYYLMAINSGHLVPVGVLGAHYQTQHRYYDALKLYMLDIDKFRVEISKILQDSDTGIVIVRKLFEKKEKIREFKWSPEGTKIGQIKDHFNQVVMGQSGGEHQ